MRCRWVLTFKDCGKAKARMVLQGFTDPDLLTLCADSPTVSRRGRMLFTQMAATHAWRCEKGDVVGAFLQGKEETEALRAVYTDPVPELRAALGLGGDEVAQVVKAGIGFTSAPRRWWEQVKRDLAECGLTAIRTEPCIWIFYVITNGQRKPIGGVCLHVDDFLIAGDHSFKTCRDPRERLRSLYSWSEWEEGCFTQTGVEIVQHDDFSFTMTQE